MKLTLLSVIVSTVLRYNRNVTPPSHLSVLYQTAHTRAADLVSLSGRCSSQSDFHIKLNVTLLFYDKLRRF